MQAQNVAVKSFELDETDVTANLQGTTVLDQNGEKCALIKIFTTATGFTFDVGSMGVQKVEQRTGEIWVYVPHGVKRLTMNHQLLGRMEYSFPMPIERARTYYMELVAGEVHTVVKRAITSQYVVFNVTPKDASIELAGQMLQVREGGASRRMPFGTYDYKVQAPRYYAKTGQVTVNNPSQKHTVTVNLEPAFSTISMSVDADAEIWIDDVKKGTRTFQGELSYGTYFVECRQAGHRTSQTEVTITPENVSKPITLPRPTPIYGSIDVNSSPVDADIYIDGKRVGTSPMFIPEYLIGQHSIRLSKAGHSDYTATITVSEGATSEVSATLQNGRSVSITTTQGADIYVDGTRVGTTSYTGNLTFGTHTAYAMLNGKRSQEKSISVNQGAASIPAVQLVFSDNMTFSVSGVSFTMIPVEGGTFTMGATREQGNDAKSDEKPTHSVTLSDYYIGQTEVTQALWEAVIGSNPSSFKGDNLPVVEISWNDCQTFISKLNALTGRNFRLPTEAEWEYAARGGNKSRGYKYSGSNSLGDVSSYTYYGASKNDVATKQPNEIGIYDMSGNVNEWCSDWYDRYNSYAQTNPQGASSGSYRVNRGGSYRSSMGSCRVSCRSGNVPDFRYEDLGVRLVLPQ